MNLKFSNNKFSELRINIKLFKGLYKFLNKKQKSNFLKLLFLVIICGISEIISISSVIPFLNTLLNFQNEESFLIKSINNLNIFTSNQVLIILGLLFILINFLNAFLRIINIKKSSEFTRDISSHLSQNIYTKIINSTYLEYLSMNSSNIINNITIDIPRVSLIITSFFQLITCLSVSIFIILGLIIYDWKVTLYSIIFFGICYFFINSYTKKKIKSNGRKIAKNSKNQIKFVQESFGSIREIILNSLQNINELNFKEIDYSIRELSSQNIFLINSPRYILEAITLSLIIFLSIVFTLSSPNNSTPITLLGVFALATQKILPSLQQIFASFSLATANQVHLKNVVKLLSNCGDNLKTEEVSKNLKFLKTIELKNIYFKYNTKPNYVLKNVNLKIFKGQNIGLIGPTGVGKSTLINIILGLFIAQKGDLLIDNKKLGRKVHSHEIKQWQSLIAYVPQNIYLLDDTFTRNIAFINDGKEVDIQKVKDAAKKAGILDFILDSPESFNTRIGERGISLSGGQCQRIGLARAFYKNAELLVLDEATSALDNATEKRIMDTIYTQKESITTLMIAHRISTLNNCDRIFELTNEGLKIIKDNRDNL